jgi:cobalamin synthase
MVLAAFLSRRFAGLTGDTYGAIVEITEVTALIIISLLAEWGC